MITYLIPGLGYDHRIFENLQLDEANVQRVDWIEPRPNESLRAYAGRLCEEWSPHEQAINIVGHSFGGMMAQEIAAIRPVDKLVLLSSVRSRAEIPWFFQIVKPLQLHRLFTRDLCVKTIPYWGKSHGFESKAEQALFKSMVGSQTNTYLQWALQALSAWQAPILLPDTEVVQIHGTHDKTFPINLLEAPTITVENGSHIMVYKRAQEISQLINGELG